MGFSPPRYTPCPARPGHHRAVVVGAGLVGLTLALDLAQRGVPVVVLDDDDTVSTGSRAICMAQRTLEIFGRLGLGDRMLAKGITWNTGRVFLGDREVFHFDLLPEPGHAYPAFINLQQYYAEAWLVEACVATGLVDLRWRHSVRGVQSRADGAVIGIDTPEGSYELTADWLLAADGARSQVRRCLQLPFVGRVFRDRFLIADVVMQAPFPSERRFWFDPPFHPNQSALLHKQPDNVWRIDLQLGWDADPDEEAKPERVIPRVRAMLGPEAAFTLEWVSLYTFRCRRLERFVHGRVVFVGDSAHQVSPFGARGGNGGVQDADNLAWKLAAVLQGHAPPTLIDSYDAERIPAADENILHSTRATDFITPKSNAARAYRDATLRLAEHHAFARPFVNSGRLSKPCTLPLAACHADDWPGAPTIGSPAIDAPVWQDGQPGWLLRHIGPGFTLLAFGPAVPSLPGIATIRITPDAADNALHDATGLVARRYGGLGPVCILFRPDQHVVARFAAWDAARIMAAHDEALDRQPATALYA
ncbi:MAG: FAD-dependent oxidoreductase [Janthinobacterium lividum]